MLGLLKVYSSSGARLWDAEGNEYLDAISGVAATDLGHSHPVITAHNRSEYGLLRDQKRLGGIGQ